jgi:hypothetical protein
MNQELQRSMAEFMRTMLEIINTSAIWTADKIPVVIQEKLVFDWWFTVVCVVFGAILLICGVMLLLWIIKKDSEYNDSSVTPFLYMSATVLLLMGFITIVINLPLMLKIATAPNLYILEWIQKSLQ